MAWDLGPLAAQLWPESHHVPCQATARATRLRPDLSQELDCLGAPGFSPTASHHQEDWWAAWGPRLCPLPCSHQVQGWWIWRILSQGGWR